MNFQRDQKIHLFNHAKPLENVICTKMHGAVKTKTFGVKKVTHTDFIKKKNEPK